MDRLECLERNKICSMNNRKCKDCKLLDCRNTLKLIEEEEKMWFETKEELFQKELKKKYPQCAGCSHLQILDLDKKKVYCPYMIRRCVLK